MEADIFNGYILINNLYERKIKMPKSKYEVKTLKLIKEINKEAGYLKSSKDNNHMLAAWKLYVDTLEAALKDNMCNDKLFPKTLSLINRCFKLDKQKILLGLVNDVFKHEKDMTKGINMALEDAIKYQELQLDAIPDSKYIPEQEDKIREVNNRLLLIKTYETMKEYFDQLLKPN